MRYCGCAFTVTRYLPTMMAVIFLLSAVVSGQDKPAEIEKRDSFLRHPTNLSVELVRERFEQYNPPGELTRPFKPTENIYFALMVKSNLPEPLAVRSFNPYYQNRPTLLRDGNPVPYRKDVAERLAQIDGRDEALGNILDIALKPGAPTLVERIELSYWYDTLEPGNYQLSNCHRFIFEGDWVDMPPITFKVRK